ncbi:MAG: DUF2059 domain-containing protein [Proteobacteria bacterium]|nr:DUF2059 domain-containing protein [Pseudomonadota bacterium]
MSIGAANAAPQASGGASDREVRELLGILDLDRTIGQFNANTATMIERALPCAPAAMVRASFDSPAVVKEQIDRLVPIYQRHFSSADVRGLLVFFRSPLGAKWLQASPAITEEAMQAGRQSGQQRLQQMVATLKKQGILDAQGACPAAKQAPAVPPPSGH